MQWCQENQKEDSDHIVRIHNWSLRSRAALRWYSLCPHTELPEIHPFSITHYWLLIIILTPCLLVLFQRLCMGGRGDHDMQLQEMDWLWFYCKKHPGGHNTICGVSRVFKKNALKKIFKVHRHSRSDNYPSLWVLGRRQPPQQWSLTNQVDW